MAQQVEVMRVSITGGGVIRHDIFISKFFHPRYGRQVDSAYNLTTFMCWLSRNPETATSSNHTGLYKDWFTFKFTQNTECIVELQQQQAASVV